MGQFVPIIYDPSTSEHRPAVSGDQIGTLFIPLDGSSDNLLKQTVNGLLVDKDDIDTSLSQQAGNYLRYGNDRGLFLDGNDVLSNGTENLLHIDRIDGKATLTKADLVAAGFNPEGGTTVTVVSSDANNVLVRGTDGGAYLNASSITSGGPSSDVGNILRAGSDNKAYLSRDVIETIATAAVSPESMVSTSSPNVLSVGRDGGLMVVPADLRSSTSTNILKIGTDGGLYVHAADTRSTDLNNLLTTGTDGGVSLVGASLLSTEAGNTARLGTDGKLFVPASQAANLFDPNDKILGVNTSGLLTSTLTADFDVSSNTLILKGKNGETVTSVVLPASASTLERVEVVVNPTGMPAGTYLAMTFKKEDGTSETVYVDMSAVGDVYTAGSGIDITSRVISAKVATGGGLEVDSSGRLKMTAAAMNPVSSDAGNIILQGSDGKAYLPHDLGTM